MGKTREVKINKKCCEANMDLIHFEKNINNGLGSYGYVLAFQCIHCNKVILKEVDFL